MWLNIGTIQGSKVGTHAGVGENKSVVVHCQHEGYRDQHHFAVTITASTVHVRQTDADYDSLPVKAIDVATVEVAPDLIAATRRLHNMVR